MSHDAADGGYVLGLDLGSASLGWAAIRTNDDSTFDGVLAIGVRGFEAGVDGDIEQGKDASRGVVRRQARQQRRQLWRRAWRRRRVLRTLQRMHLLPQGDSSTPNAIHQLILALDKQLRAKWVDSARRTDAHVMPYRLRAAALDRPMEAHELGRAIYHLAQRRGFLSNRKTDSGKQTEDLGTVKQAISELDRQMQQAQSRTLGEYLAGLDPESTRIRQRWTARSMYEDEFDRIIAAQTQHHPQLLTDAHVSALKRAIFAQRPLKSQRSLIGRCELERQRKRAPLALPLAQRFRLLAAVNNLVIYQPDGQRRALSPQERSTLIHALQYDGDRTFDQIRTLLNLNKTKTITNRKTGQTQTRIGYSFNLENDGGENRLCGDRTGVKLREVFGSRWDELDPLRQERIVRQLLDIEREATLQRLATQRWGLDAQQTEKLLMVRLEQAYASFSRSALRRLVPRMEEGLPVATAIKDEYGDRPAPEPVNVLPPVRQALTDLRNPAVERALTELRKVVNALVRQYGKPRVIRIELARELKQPRKVRQEQWKRNRERQKHRDSAEAAILKVPGVVRASRQDKEKYLLAVECGWVCPYTSRGITPESLFGPNPQFDVEHIIPMSISLDNTFVNKTLCYHEFNRHHKTNRIPIACYDATSQSWHEVLQRVRRFAGPTAKAKLERFLMTQEQVESTFGDFSARHLADTRYASRLASDYLGLLFGGVIDGKRRRRVQASSGGVTAHLRRELQLEGVLPRLPDLPKSPAEIAPGEKIRFDHRHHAVDAVAIALSSPAEIKKLADAAEAAPSARRRLFAPIEAPWPTFLDDVQCALHNLVVSHRADRRLAGPLHAETNYSPMLKVFDAQSPRGRTTRHVRKPLSRMSRGEIQRIVDPRVRQAVLDKLSGGEPAKVFADPANHPCLFAKDGRCIPIRHPRITVNNKPFRIGGGPATRHVDSGKDTLHHTVIVCEQTTRGERWVDEPVTRLEAHHRLRERRPIIQRNWPQGRSFVMSLCKGDCLEMQDADGKRRVYVVRSISKSDITVRLHHDARTEDLIKQSGQRSEFRIRSADALRQRKAQKVSICPLGQIAYAGD